MSSSPGTESERSRDYVLSREFLDQYEINSRQLSDLIRAKKFTTAKAYFLAALFGAGVLVVALAVLNSPAYVNRSIITQTFGPLVDFGVALMAMLALLIVLLLVVYWVGLSIMNALETRGRICSLIERQKEVIGEMAPYVIGEMAPYVEGEFVNG